MKVCMLYHPNSEFSRLAEEYVRDFERRKGVAIELISLDTRDGADLAALYDIVRYPALLVRRDNADLVKHWEGEPLPLMDEVSGFLV